MGLYSLSMHGLVIQIGKKPEGPAGHVHPVCIRQARLASSAGEPPLLQKKGVKRGGIQRQILLARGASGKRGEISRQVQQPGMKPQGGANPGDGRIIQSMKRTGQQLIDGGAIRVILLPQKPNGIGAGCSGGKTLQAMPQPGERLHTLIVAYRMQRSASGQVDPVECQCLTSPGQLSQRFFDSPGNGPQLAMMGAVERNDPIRLLKRGRPEANRQRVKGSHNVIVARGYREFKKPKIGREKKRTSKITQSPANFADRENKARFSRQARPLFRGSPKRESDSTINHETTRRICRMLMEELLTEAVERNASDVHISAGLSPVFRINGQLARAEYPPLSKDDSQRLIFSILANDQRRVLEQNWELDFSYGIQSVGRFRVNVYKTRGSYAAAFRTITSKVPSFEDLGLPPIVRDIANKPRGLVLVTGATGSGKSTTLAAMIDWINENKAEHILTIEDPIEFLHVSKKSVVHQRELGQDTRSFANALKSALREDPDVILVGEMRDLETIALAITAAETGHLVMGTLHTSSAIQTVDRIVDVFPPEQQHQIRVQLSNSLIAVLSQALLPKINKIKERDGRILAQEIMVVTPAMANMIREGKTAQMYSSIQTGVDTGMQTLEMALKDLYQQGTVLLEDIMSKTSRPDDLKRMLSSIGAPIVARV